MEIVVLGGARGMGSWAVEDLVTAEGVERVTVADRNVVGLDVWGEVGGEEVHRMACGIGTMREATGLSLSVGTLMLARGEVTVEGGGVYAPEACFDPETFLTRLGAKGIRAYADLEMAQPIL